MNGIEMLLRGTAAKVIGIVAAMIAMFLIGILLIENVGFAWFVLSSPVRAPRIFLGALLSLVAWAVIFIVPHEITEHLKAMVRQVSGSMLFWIGIIMLIIGLLLFSIPCVLFGMLAFVGIKWPEIAWPTATVVMIYLGGFYLGEGLGTGMYGILALVLVGLWSLTIGRIWKQLANATKERKLYLSAIVTVATWVPIWFLWGLWANAQL